MKRNIVVTLGVLVFCVSLWQAQSVSANRGLYRYQYKHGIVSSEETTSFSQGTQEDFCGELKRFNNKGSCVALLKRQGNISLLQKQIFQQGENLNLKLLFCRKLANTSDKNLCNKVLKRQNMYFHEKEEILLRAKTGALTSEICTTIANDDNKRLCSFELWKQNQNCSKQVISENKIIVDLQNQLLYGVKDCRLEVYSRIITGKNTTPTPAGTFQVYNRRGPHHMQQQWYVTKAFYYSGDYAIHDATWRTESYMWNVDWRKWGGSHGCVNTPSEAMQIIWNEFDVGSSVEVYRVLPEDIALELRKKVGSREPTLPDSGQY